MSTVAERRRTDLLRARARIDTRLARMDVAVLATAVANEQLIRNSLTTDLAERARSMVWAGHTHIEVAIALGLPSADLVAPLIAPRAA